VNKNLLCLKFDLIKSYHNIFTIEECDQILKRKKNENESRK